MEGGFQKTLKSIGYELILKPVKLFKQDDGSWIRKANCDVDLTYFAMRDFKEYDRGIFMTGDGDFEILFLYLIKKGKTVQIIANGKRTAWKIKKLAKGHFTEIGSLKSNIEYIKTKRR